MERRRRRDLPGRGHGEKSEIGTDVVPHPPGEGDREVQVEAPLVELVEHDRADAREQRILGHLPQEDPVGDEADPRGGGDATVEADLVAHLRADLAAELEGDPPRRGPGREPPRFEDHHRPVPGETGPEDRRRHARRLPRARRRGKDEGRAWRYTDARGTWVQLDLSPDEVETGAEARREVIFVLDCSGSMGGDSIAQAKRALEVCLKALETGCSFNVVRFGSSFQSLFPHPREYGERSLGEALGWLKAVEADLGGTEVLAPLSHVYQSPVAQGVARSVILLTDGEVGNEAEVMSLVRTHAAGTRFFQYLTVRTAVWSQGSPQFW